MWESNRGRKRGTTLDRLSGVALSRAHGEGWENCLIANVTQWNVFGGLGVVTD